MPYVDLEAQRAYNRDWHRQRLELCPRCPNLKCPESLLCRECRHRPCSGAQRRAQRAQRMFERRPRG